MRPLSKPPLYTPVFMAISAAHLLLAVPILSQVPVISWRIGQLGGSRADVGMAMTAAIVGGLLSRMLLGPVLDRVGRRVVFIVGGTLATIAFPLYAYVHEPDGMMLALRALHGAGMGALFPALFTYASDISPGSRRIEGLAVFGSVGLLGLATGPGLGSWLVATLSFDGYLTCAAIGTLAGTLAAALCPEPARQRSAERTPLHPLGWMKAFDDPRLRSAWVVTFCWGLSFALAFNFLERLVTERELGSVGWFLTPYGLVAVLLRLIGRSVPDRLGAVRVLGPSLLIQGAGFAVLAAADHRWLLVVGGLLGGVGHGYAFPTMNALVVGRGRPDRIGLNVNAFTIMIDVGPVLLLPAAGWMADLYGFGPLMLTSAAIAALGILPLYLETPPPEEGGEATVVVEAPEAGSAAPALGSPLAAGGELPMVTEPDAGGA